MLRRSWILVPFAVPALGQGKGKGKGQSQGSAPVFSDPERTMLLDYYGPRFSNLPPGHQKQLIRKGTLPPGIAKKMIPLPPDLERRLPPACGGCRRMVYDQWALLIHDATNIVLDIIDLARR